ncbi:MAG: PqqD family protein [Eubacteriales bacterium]
MKIKGELILREIAGEHILIPTGASALEIKGMISLSESGVLLWERLQNECTEEELIDAVLDAYDIDRETAALDVRSFLDRLRELNLL